jgi:hypothetical protein
MQFGRQSSRDNRAEGGHLNRRSRVSEPQLRRAAVGAVLDDSGGGDGAVDAERGAPGVGRGRGRGRHVGGGRRRPLELRRQARHRGARAGCLLASPGCRLHCCREEREVEVERGDGGDEIQVCLASLDKGSSGSVSQTAELRPACSGATRSES